MGYARWMSEEELRSNLIQVKEKKDIKKSGIIYSYDNDAIYVSDGEEHTLVVGTTGSGKTQAVTLPLLKTSLLANDNVLVNDPQGEIYARTANLFKEEGYEVVLLNYNDLTKGNNYNVLSLPYALYKDGQKDEAYDLLNDLSYYLFYEKNEPGKDPFWINSARDYFIGLALYLFEQNKEEVTLNQIFNLSEKYIKEGKEIFDELDKSSKPYIYLSSIINAPMETRGGIISVFGQKIKYLINHDNLTSAMSKSDYDLSSLVTKKNVVYLVGDEKAYAKSLISVFVSQYIYANNKYGDKDIRKNIILDQFEDLLPIESFASLLPRLRSNNIKMTMLIKGFKELEKNYGKDTSDAIKINVGTILYLLSNEIETLNEISVLCGKSSENSCLITPEELKVLDMFEAVIVKVRWMPVRTKMIPDYKIPWDFDNKEAKMFERKC